MIDEKKLIQDLFLKMPHQFGVQVMEWFRNLVEEQPKVGEWVPCSDNNLPEKEVLCCDRYGEMMLGYVFKTEEGIYNAESEHEYMYDCVAWQCKPAKYQE